MSTEESKMSHSDQVLQEKVRSACAALDRLGRTRGAWPKIAIQAVEEEIKASLSSALARLGRSDDQQFNLYAAIADLKKQETDGDGSAGEG